MARSKSSRRWLDRHINDPYVKRSQLDGYRSRAAYKLLEIQEKDHLIKPGMRILDLGAAPGSWSQIASRLAAPNGCVVALDVLPMEPIPAVGFLQGDFREAEVLSELETLLGGEPLDLVLSDMAPNLTGMPVVDQARAIYLVELALDLARRRLKHGGALVVKTFSGAGFDDFMSEARVNFRQVATRKPKSSRAESREVYLVAKGFHP
jgi:23S rRNA (uridine2552-2'-O)-methyltransferase